MKNIKYNALVLSVVVLSCSNKIITSMLTSSQLRDITKAVGRIGTLAPWRREIPSCEIKPSWGIHKENEVIREIAKLHKLKFDAPKMLKFVNEVNPSRDDAVTACLVSAVAEVPVLIQCKERGWKVFPGVTPEDI